MGYRDRIQSLPVSRQRRRKEDPASSRESRLDRNISLSLRSFTEWIVRSVAIAPSLCEIVFEYKGLPEAFPFQRRQCIPKKILQQTVIQIFSVCAIGHNEYASLRPVKTTYDVMTPAFIMPFFKEDFAIIRPIKVPSPAHSSDELPDFLWSFLLKARETHALKQSESGDSASAPEHSCLESCRKAWLAPTGRNRAESSAWSPLHRRLDAFRVFMISLARRIHLHSHSQSDFPIPSCSASCARVGR